MGQSNYHEWSIEIKATTHFTNVWKVIQGTNKAISTDASDQATYESHEEKVIGLITRMVSSHLKIELNEYQVTDSTKMPTIKHDANANNLWGHLKIKFEKKDGVSAIINYGCLTQTKLINDGTLEEQLTLGPRVYITSGYIVIF